MGINTPSGPNKNSGGGSNPPAQQTPVKKLQNDVPQKVHDTLEKKK
jgi:hypothetical protein